MFNLGQHTVEIGTAANDQRENCVSLKLTNSPIAGVCQTSGQYRQVKFDVENWKKQRITIQRVCEVNDLPAKTPGTDQTVQ